MHQTRRIFLKGGLVAGGGLLLSALGTTMEVSASERGDTAQTILNLAATAEAFATTHIHTVLTGRDFALSNFEIQQLKLILDAEQQHLDLIVANGGVPAATQFFTPAGTYHRHCRCRNSLYRSLPCGHQAFRRPWQRPARRHSGPTSGQRSAAYRRGTATCWPGTKRYRLGPPALL
jgi:hypothetical protein